MAEAHQRDKLERLCRYISRPAVSEKRLALTANGQVRYELKTLKRVFNIDIEVCEHCGGHVKVIASIEDPKVIEQILKHLKQKTAKANAAKQRELPPERAPPLTPSLFDPSQSRLFD